MKLPNQSANITRYHFASASGIAKGKTGAYPSASRQLVIRGIDQISARPMPTAGPSPNVPTDHSLLNMMLNGCSCISPNCVALSCPADCVEGGKFIC